MTACNLVQARDHAKQLLLLNELCTKKPQWATLESVESFSPWLAVSSNTRYPTSQAPRARPKDGNAEQGRAAATAESSTWFLGITTTAYHYNNNNGCYRQYKLHGEKLPAPNYITLKAGNGKNVNAVSAEQAAGDREKASYKLTGSDSTAGETALQSSSYLNGPAEIFSEAVMSKTQLSTKSDNLFGNSLQKYSLIEQPMIKKLSFTNQATVETAPLRDSLFGGGGNGVENSDITTHQIFAKIRKGSLISAGKLVSTRDLMNFKPDNEIRIVNSNPALSTLNTRSVLAPLRENTHLSLQEMTSDQKESGRLLLDSDASQSDQYLSFVANPDSLWRVNKSSRKKKSLSTDLFEDQSLSKDSFAVLSLGSANNPATVLSSRIPPADAVSAFDVLPDTPLHNSGNRLGLATADFYAADTMLHADATFMDGGISFSAKARDSSDVLPMKSSRSFQVSSVKHEKLEPVFLDTVLPEISGRRVSVGQSSRRIL